MIMKNKEKFLELVEEKDNSILKEIKWRKDNRDMLRESQNIAFKVLIRLNELNWSQKDLAEAMKVSPQQINKIVKGAENMTIETQVKIQTILNIPILASYIEKQQLEKENILNISTKGIRYKINRTLVGKYKNLIGKKSSVHKLDYNTSTGEYSTKMTA